MNTVREIVTKAVVGKGKKIIKLKEKIKPQYQATSILGCLVLNHQFEAHRVDDQVEVSGVFELNVWYSYDNYLKTDVAKHVIEYREKMKIVPIIGDATEGSDIIVKILQHPTCLDGIITLDMIELDIVFEAQADIVGETKISISILENSNVWPEDFDIDNNVNENFINQNV